MNPSRPSSSSPSRARDTSPGPCGGDGRGISPRRDEWGDENYWPEDWCDYYDQEENQDDDKSGKKPPPSYMSIAASSYKDPLDPSDPGSGGGGPPGGPPGGLPGGPPGEPPGGPPIGPGDGGLPPPDLPRRKEADKVSVPAFPKVETVERWKANLLSSIQEASAYTDSSEIKWLKQVRAPGTQPLDLEPSKIEIQF